MDMQARKSLHPLAWVAGITAILFGAAGIAAIMGWIPTSTGSSGNNVALEKLKPDAAIPAAPKTQRTPAHPSSTTKPSVPKAQTPPVQVADNAPPVTSRCAECGVIESVREVQHPGQSTGLGAVGGAVVGGLLGNQVGSGRGNTVATIAGAVGGTVAGNEIEKRVKSGKGYEITVRFEDGSTRVINSASAPSWRTGDRVRVVDGVIHSNP